MDIDPRWRLRRIEELFLHSVTFAGFPSSLVCRTVTKECDDRNSEISKHQRNGRQGEGQRGPARERDKGETK